MQGGHFYGRKTDRGIYRKWGKAPQALNPGDVVNIPAGVKHRHGAAADRWFDADTEV